MLNTKALEMLNQNKIEELKDILRDEIYQDALKKKPGAKQRYAAMKKYFGYVRTARKACMKPAMIEFEGKTYTSFCNSYSLALTTEPCGGIVLFTDDDGTYPDTGRLIKREGVGEKVDICGAIAEAKSLGYKLTKAEVTGNGFMLHYNGAYFRLGLIDATYSIINNGDSVVAYHSGKNVSPIVVENEIGICLMLPVRCGDEFIQENGCTVIELKGGL